MRRRRFLSDQSDQSDRIYQLKITLRHSKPPIWRRVLVPGSMTLEDLHEIIQIVMGWEDDHLHEFEIGGKSYSSARFQLDDVYDESRVTLQEVAPPPGKQFTYIYDFGDWWEHVIKVEDVFPPQPGQRYPQCIGGRRAAPPEDVGGMWGYYHFLEALNNPEHPDHEHFVDWWGDEPFDPNAFDPEEVNEVLQEVFSEER